LKAYCDSSFLVSLYSPDAHSTPAAAQCRRPGVALWVTPLCELEVHNALRLRVFRKELSAPEAAAATAAFRHDLDSGVFISHPLSARVFAKARQLSEQYTHLFGTRTLDTLHVASALVAQAGVLWTFDAAQRRLAKAAGLACAPVSG